MKIFLCLFALFGIIITSCTSCGPKQLAYFNGLDTAKINQLKAPEPLIQKGDLLGIIVYSDNPTATALYNQPIANAGNNMSGNGSAGPVSTQSDNMGYMVDHRGNIQFQGLGTLHVEGLTMAQLTDLLDSRLKDTLLNNPYYSIRFLNYKITMLGDVNKPGVYSVPSERVSIMEAIGLAGDLTIWGIKDKVMVIREVNGVRETGTIDLTKPEAMASPYYYLRQNDMVIVPAYKRKAQAQDLTTLRNVSIATSIISAAGIIISIVNR